VRDRTSKIEDRGNGGKKAVQAATEWFTVHLSHAKAAADAPLR
jgi:hypothetical protein